MPFEIASILMWGKKNHLSIFEIFFLSSTHTHPPFIIRNAHCIVFLKSVKTAFLRSLVGNSPHRAVVGEMEGGMCIKKVC